MQGSHEKHGFDSSGSESSGSDEPDEPVGGKKKSCKKTRSKKAPVQQRPLKIKKKKGWALTDTKVYVRTQVDLLWPYLLTQWKTVKGSLQVSISNINACY